MVVIRLASVAGFGQTGQTGGGRRAVRDNFESMESRSSLSLFVVVVEPKRQIGHFFLLRSHVSSQGVVQSACQAEGSSGRCTMEGQRTASQPASHSAQSQTISTTERDKPTDPRMLGFIHPSDEHSIHTLREIGATRRQGRGFLTFSAFDIFPCLWSFVACPSIFEKSSNLRTSPTFEGLRAPCLARHAKARRWLSRLLSPELSIEVAACEFRQPARFDPQRRSTSVSSSS